MRRPEGLALRNPIAQDGLEASRKEKDTPLLEKDAAGAFLLNKMQRRKPSNMLSAVVTLGSNKKAWNSYPSAKEPRST